MIKLKVFFSFLIFTGLLVVGCKTPAKVSSFEQVLYPNGRKFTVKSVDDTNRKRFEYFLMEAARYKMLGDINKSVLYYKEALGVDSACAVCYFELSQLIYQSGDVKNAEAFALNAVQLDPSNEWYLSFLSKVYHQNDKTALALETSRYLSSQYPDNVEHIYNLAQYQYSQAKYDEAISSLNRIEKLLGKSEVLSLEKHSIFIQKKDFKAAEKELKALIDTNPANLDYQVYLGDYYTQRGRLVEAFTQYQKVIAADSINGMALFGLANYYNLQGDSTSFKSTIIKGFSSTRLDFESKLQRLLPFLMNIEDAKNPLRKTDFQAIFDVLIATHPHETKVYLLYANYLNHTGNIPGALVAYENALAIEQNQEEIWQEFLFLSLNGHPKDVFLKNCKTAIGIYPENPIMNYLTGVSFSLNEDRKSAIFYLNQVLKFSKDNARLESQAYGFLGDLYYQEDDSAKSFESYQSSLAIDDNQVNVLNNYAYYLSLEELNLDKAEKMISKVIEMEPQNPTYLDTYAWVLFKRERYFEALFIIEQAISFDKEQGGVLFEHYGDILYKNGNVEKAVEFWIKASETKEEGLSENLLLKISEKRYIK